MEETASLELGDFCSSQVLSDNWTSVRKEPEGRQGISAEGLAGRGAMVGFRL